MKDLIVCLVVFSTIAFNHATKEGETLEFGEDFKGLKAEVLIAPKEDCERYSKRGDLLTVHYIGIMAEGMIEYENRYASRLYLFTQMQVRLISIPFGLWLLL